MKASVFLMLLFAALPAGGGVQVFADWRARDDPRRSAVYVLEVEGDLLRLEIRGAGERLLLLYGGGEDLYRVADLRRRWYAEATGFSLGLLRPVALIAHRAAHERLAGGRGPAAEAYRAFAENLSAAFAAAPRFSSAGSWRGHRVLAGTGEMGVQGSYRLEILADFEGWLPEPERETYRTVRARLFEYAAPLLEFYGADPERVDALAGSPALPLAFVHRAEGEVLQEFRLRALERKSLDASRFQIPEGLQKRSLIDVLGAIEPPVFRGVLGLNFPHLRVESFK